MGKEDKTKIQQIVGSLLYHARAVDLTLLVAHNTILRPQSNPTRQTVATITQILDYVVTNHNATIVNTPSDMILKAHTDALYLSEPGAKSRFRGHFYIAQQKTDLL